MACVLIVAYGNPLRCDDGIAWRAADALEGKFSDTDVEILRLHQLAPEVADSLRTRDLVIFLDAACVDDIGGSRPGEIRVREVPGTEIAEHRPGQFSHVYSPEKVLDLARELYNATPKAYVITVAGQNFDHGECLSVPVANSVPELLARIHELLASPAQASATTTDTK